MTPYVPTPMPDPMPDWMHQCNLAYFSGSSANPIDMAYCPPNGQTSEIRYQWWPKFDGDTQYSPNGQELVQWMSDDPRISFEGLYDNKKVIHYSGDVPPDALVWVRFWNENGFVWDSPTLKVAG